MVSDKLDVTKLHPVSTEVKQAYVETNLTEGIDDNKVAKLLEESQANLKLVEETGHSPELCRNFNIWSLLGLGFGLTNSWLGISATLITGIASGGPIVIIYGVILVAIISMAIAVSLSELSSSMPSAGGQYYWTMKLAPPKYASFLAYLCGAFAWAGSVFASASVTISIATALVGMYALGQNDPDFTVKTWHVFITYEIVNVLLVTFNIWEKPLPALSQGALYISLSSFVIITIVVLAKLSGNYASAEFVFAEFNNGTGWSSSAIAFIVGLINPTFAFSGLDAATHLAEEIINPETQIPKSILLTVLIGFVTSFIYAIAMFFSITDIDAVLYSTTGVPIMDIFHQALKSKAGAIGLEVLIVLTAIFCNIAAHTWQARLCWAFARDDGLPGSRYWSVINETTKQPINAHIMSCAWCAIIGCIYMASTSAFNAMVTGCILFLLLSYAIPIICLLIKGRDNIRHGPFWLGKLGMVCNYVLILWAIFCLVFYSFPPTMPVNGLSMNYVCVVVVVFFAYCVIYWVARGKSRFKTNEDHTADPLELSQLSTRIDQLEIILSNKEVEKDTQC